MTIPHTGAYAVIFTSRLSEQHADYAVTAERMMELAAQQNGFIGVDSVRENGLGITVSYWQDEESIHQWKQNLQHQQAQSMGKSQWYEDYTLLITRVERAYGFER